MACGEGYGTDVLASRAAHVTGVDANPEAHEHAKAKYTRPGVRFERDLIDSYSEPCDAVVFLQTIEHLEDPAAALRHFRQMAKTVYVSTPNVLTLAPKGAESSDNPWHLKSTGLRSSGELCGVVRGRPHPRPLSRAQAAGTRARAEGGLGRRPPEARHHRALLRPLHSRDLRADFALRPGPLDRALDFVAVLR